MTLRLRPSSTPYDALYKSVIESITPGTQFVKAPSSDTQSFVLPYTENQPASFILEADIGVNVKIYINNTQVKFFRVDKSVTEVYLQLVPGRNFILVKSSFEDYLIQVAATNYATFLRAWSTQFFNNCVAKVDSAALQLNSNFSLRSVEHQLIFQELLPPPRMFRVLAGKMAVRAMINETGTTRGVNDIATAITNTTPVVVPTTVNLEKYEPGVYHLYDNSHDFGGFEFNIWVPNTIAASWAAFIQLANNLDDSILKLTSVSDLKVSFENQGIPESHIFDYDAPNTDIVGIVTRLLDCFYAVHVGVNVESLMDFSFCAWQPSSHIVDSPIGVNTLDVGETLDSGNLLDLTDPSDPYNRDGWLNTPLSHPLDSNIPLDTLLGVSLLEDLECEYEPYLTILGSSLLDITLQFNTSVDVNLIIDNNDYGWIIGQSQLNIDNYLS